MVRRLLFVMVIGLVIFAVKKDASLAQDCVSCLTTAIISFDSDVNAVSLTDVEAGSQVANLSWHIEYARPNQVVRLYARWLTGWNLIVDNADPVGTAEVSVTHPGNFARPAFRLTVEDRGTLNVLDEALLTLDYTALTGKPTIDHFDVIPQVVSPQMLEQGQALVTGLSWQVSNRPPTANLMFEQLMPDGSMRLAELPRGLLWLPSSGQNGVVAPITPGEADSVTILLRLVDLASGGIYDEATVEIPIGTPGQPTRTALTTPAAGTTAQPPSETAEASG